MPEAPLRPCRGYPSCSALVRGGGYCDKCKAKRANQRREAQRRTNQPWKGKGSATARGYGKDWEAAKASYIADHPVCEVCGHAPTRIVHHKIPVEQAPHLRLDPDNFMGVCSETCHRQAERMRPAQNV